MAKNIELRMSDGNSYNKNGFNIKTSWENIDGKPTNFVPEYHEHSTSEIQNLDTQLTNINNELNNKIEVGDIPLPILSIDKPISELNNNTLRDIFETKYPQINSYKLNEELYNYIDYDNLIFYENVGKFEVENVNVTNTEYDIITKRFIINIDNLNFADYDLYSTFSNSWGFPNQFMMTVDREGMQIYHAGDILYLYFRINQDKIIHLGDDWKERINQYLVLNPLTITYELAEKQEIQLTEQDLNNLPKTNEELDYYFKLYEKYKNDPLFDEEGKIEEGLIPYLSASKINSGVFHEEAIPILPQSKITGLTDLNALVDELENTTVRLSGNQTIDGIKTFRNIKLYSSLTNQDFTALRIGDRDGSFGFDIRYIGTATGNDNDLELWADNQQTGSPIKAFGIKQDGIVSFGKIPMIDNDTEFEWLVTSKDARLSDPRKNIAPLKIRNGYSPNSVVKEYIGDSAVELNLENLLSHAPAESGVYALGYSTITGIWTPGRISQSDVTGLQDRLDQLEINADNYYLYDITGSGNGIVRFFISGQESFTHDFGHSHQVSQVTGLENRLDGKVDKVTGKGLSTNDFTAALKSKLDGIESGANRYTHPSYTDRSTGLYKVRVNDTGHVDYVSNVLASDIPNLPTSKITSGTFDVARIPIDDLNIPTDLDDLILAGADQVPVRTTVGWTAASQVPDSTRWGGYRIREGSGGSSGYITFEPV